MLTKTDIIRMLATDHRCCAVVLSGILPTLILPLLDVLTTPFELRLKLRMSKFRNTFCEEFERSSSRIAQSVNSVTQALRPRYQNQMMPLPKGRNEGDRSSSVESQTQGPRGTGKKLVAGPPQGSATSDEEAFEVSKVYKENRRANLTNLQVEQKIAALTEVGSWTRQNPVGQILGQVNAPRRIIPRDGEGRRLDPPLTFPMSLVEKMERKHYCNPFHLKGHCPYPKCKHLHLVLDEATKLLRRLTLEETETLRFIARRSPCRHGTACTLVDCWAGHRCINHIQKGKRICCFPDSMHFEDKSPVNLSRGEGSKERA